MNALELTGRARTHLVDLPDLGCSVHADVAAPLAALRRAAAGAGIDLTPVSAFRDFERQLGIWNGKYAGERVVVDEGGAALDVAVLAPAMRVEAILRWSALPGASRHHWGTDLDLIDAGAVPPGYRVQLTPEEFAPGGPFAHSGAWLEAQAGRFGFFRPYRGRRSGVAAEPWHYSFAPVAEGARRRLSAALLGEALAAAPMLGKEHVLARLEELHGRFVNAVDPP